MSDLARDSVLGGEAPLQEGETVQAEFHADPGAFWRAHGLLALVGGAVAGAVLVAMGDANPWVGPLGAILAVGARAAYLRSEALAARWRLTDRRLLGPGLRAVPRASIATARRFFGDVQVVTTSGDKHLMKYMADGAAVAAAIRRASTAGGTDG